MSSKNGMIEKVYDLMVKCGVREENKKTVFAQKMRSGVEAGELYEIDWYGTKFFLPTDHGFLKYLEEKGGH